MADEQARAIYEFGEFWLDPAERLLARRGELVHLQQKAFDTLVLLVENSGHLVRKDELIGTVWADAFVEENNLTKNIHALRRALNGDGEQFIETVPRQGYRFTGKVEIVGADARMRAETVTRRRLVIREETIESDTSRRSWVAAGVTATLLLSGVAAFLWFRAPSRLTSAAGMPGPRSIAVLPFKTAGAEGGDDAGLEMADELNARLGYAKELSVRSTGSIQKYANADRDPAAIGRELNTDTVLDANIETSGANVSVNARLVRTRDGSTLWSEKFDASGTDMFDVQTAVIARITSGLDQPPSEQEQVLIQKRDTNNNEAHEAYLTGRAFWNKRTPQDMRESVKYFRHALKLDPDYAKAYAGLADCYLLGAEKEEPEDSKVLAEKALALDDELAEAHASRAYYLSAVDWNWADAETGFRRALELNPSYATAHHWYAYHLISMGRQWDAVSEVTAAHQIDPNSLIISTDVGHIIYLSGLNPYAIELYSKVLETDPNFADAHLHLGEAYVVAGRFADAIEEFQKAGDLGKNVKGSFGYVYAVAGQRQKARQIIREFEAEDRKAPPFHDYELASIYAAFGEKDRALDWLETGYKRHTGEMALIKVDPKLASLRTEPRFQAIVRRMNLQSE